MGYKIKCDFCDETKVIMSQELDNGTLMDMRYDHEHRHIDVCAGMDENCMEWGDSLEINFCPMCGKKLRNKRSEAWKLNRGL